MATRKKTTAKSANRVDPIIEKASRVNLINFTDVELEKLRAPSTNAPLAYRLKASSEIHKREKRKQSQQKKVLLKDKATSYDMKIQYLTDGEIEDMLNKYADDLDALGYNLSKNNNEKTSVSNGTGREHSKTMPIEEAFQVSSNILSINVDPKSTPINVALNKLIEQHNKENKSNALNEGGKFRLSVEPAMIIQYQMNNYLKYDKTLPKSKDERLAEAKRKKVKFTPLNNDEKLALFTKNIKESVITRGGYTPEIQKFFENISYSDLFELMQDAYNNRATAGLGFLYDQMITVIHYDPGEGTEFLVDVVNYYKKRGKTPRQLINILGVDVVRSYLLTDDGAYTLEDFQKIGYFKGVKYAYDLYGV